MKKAISVGVIVAVMLVLSAGLVTAQFAPGAQVGPSDSDNGRQTAVLMNPDPSNAAVWTVTGAVAYIDSAPNTNPLGNNPWDNPLTVPVEGIPGASYCQIFEYVYLDVGGAAANARVSVGDVRLTEMTIGGTTYAAGSQVENGDVDIGRALTPLADHPELIPGSLTAAQQSVDILIIDVNSNGIYSLGDWLYLDINGDGQVSAPTTQNPQADLRLTPVTRNGATYAFGTKVRTLDADNGLAPLAIFGPVVTPDNPNVPAGALWRLDYVDNAGPGLYGIGDTVYLKMAPLFLNVETGDLRITAQTACHPYDAIEYGGDHDNLIDDDEVAQAIDDYMNGCLIKERKYARMSDEEVIQDIIRLHMNQIDVTTEGW